MKRINILFSMLLALLFITTACQDDDFELGEMLNKSEIDFEVVQDRSIDPGGNTVILRNNTPGTISMWDYGTGRSTRAIDTVRFAFKGNYTIKFSALTAGGVVEMDPVTIEVTEDNLNYVNDPLWTALTGGPGNEKTWILDYGEHGMFDGPLYYYEPQTTWEDFQAGTAQLGWAPSYADNPWIISEADKASTMTFSLKGGPFLTTHKVTEGVDESGTYSFDAEGHTISTTNATILRSADFIPNASNWTDNLVVLSLTEDAMQIGVRRTNSEGDYLYVWNYISKEYADNWVPVEEEPQPDEGFDPTFAPGELLNMLTGGPSSGRVWVLDAAGNPVDWLASGTGWTTSHSSSRDWGWNDTWDAAAENSWIRFDRFGGAQNYTRSQNGTITTGTFTINNETNEVTLENNTLIQNPGHWMNSTASTIKVVKAYPEEFESKGIWFGTVYDAAKDEWLVFHYILPTE